MGGVIFAQINDSLIPPFPVTLRMVCQLLQVMKNTCYAR